MNGWKVYTKAIEEWNEKWGVNAFPTPARPYPIHPDAPPATEMCCWDCGVKDHLATNCLTDKGQWLPEKERDWQRQQKITRGWGGAIPQTPRGIPSTPTRGGPRFASQSPFRPQFSINTPRTPQGPIAPPNFNREGSLAPMLWLNELGDPAMVQSPYYMPATGGQPELGGMWEFVPAPYKYDGQGNGKGSNRI